MVQDLNKWHSILEVFYEYPLGVFTVRELAKKVKLPHTTVQRYLEEMKRVKVLSSAGELRDSPSRRFRKSFFMLDKIVTSGLLVFLEEELMSSAIVVFGSVRKGEYDKNSDIDIFIETSLIKDVDLKKFERKLGHNIELFKEKSINDLPVQLKNNVLNGVKLSGQFRIE